VSCKFLYAGVAKTSHKYAKGHTRAVWQNAVSQFYTGLAHGYLVNPAIVQLIYGHKNSTNRIIAIGASLSVAYITMS